MKFYLECKKILEGFNVFPQAQTAPSTGPDQGMTTGDMQNTFPSKMETITLNFSKKDKKRIKKLRGLQRS